MAIEKLRLMDRLSYAIEVDDDLLVQQVPLLSIQPLIENAVVHGISHLTEGGQITLTIGKTKSGFCVQVVNPYRADKVKSGDQTGLDNIRQRLALIYGDKAQMTIEAGEEFIAVWEVTL